MCTVLRGCRGKAAADHENEVQEAREDASVGDKVAGAAQAVKEKVVKGYDNVADSVGSTVTQGGDKM
jgi:hypothetical protein